jgi:hypothetical protein
MEALHCIRAPKYLLNCDYVRLYEVRIKRNETLEL